MENAFDPPAYPLWLLPLKLKMQACILLNCSTLTFLILQWINSGTVY